MRYSIALAAALFAAACTTAAPIPGPPPGKTPSVADIVAKSTPADWRALDPENTIYMDFPPVN
jgi:peptidylprolyl isomerase